MKWIVVSMLILAAVLFGYAWYKIDLLSKYTACMYIPTDGMQVNEARCQQ